MLTHRHDLGHNSIIGPLYAEDLSKLLEVLGRCFTDGEDCVAQPAHAKTAQLLVEELNAELGSEERYVFDNSQPHPPLLVFSKLDDGREERLRKKLDTDD
jgi:hypothetical protein